MKEIGDAFPRGGLVLDASVLINLLGSGRAVCILRALDQECVVEQRTLREITRHPIDGVSHVDEVEALTDEGLIRTHRMTDAEYSTYLGLAVGNAMHTLGDGESAAIATATCQRLSLILDDLKARRITRERHPHVPVISSLRLFVVAGLRGSWTHDELCSCIADARRISRMSIPPEDQHIYAAIVRSSCTDSC